MDTIPQLPNEIWDYIYTINRQRYLKNYLDNLRKATRFWEENSMVYIKELEIITKTGQRIGFGKYLRLKEQNEPFGHIYLVRKEKWFQGLSPFQKYCEHWYSRTNEDCGDCWKRNIILACSTDLRKGFKRSSKILENRCRHDVEPSYIIDEDLPYDKTIPSCFSKFDKTFVSVKPPRKNPPNQTLITDYFRRGTKRKRR